MKKFSFELFMLFLICSAIFTMFLIYAINGELSIVIVCLVMLVALFSNAGTININILFG